MRMWTIIELIVLAAIGLVFVTEFLIPILFNKPLFGSFRKIKKAASSEAKKSETNSPLKEKIVNAKGKVEEVKKVQDEALENFKSARDLKKEADDLLK